MGNALENMTANPGNNRIRRLIEFDSFNPLDSLSYPREVALHKRAVTYTTERIDVRLRWMNDHMLSQSGPHRMISGKESLHGSK